MTFRIFLAAFGLLLTAAPTFAQTEPAAGAPTPGLRPSPVSYSLSAGAMFTGRFGSATYLSPTVNYQLSNRWRLFGGVTYLRTMPGAAFATAEGAPRAGLAGTNHYLIQGGGTYAVSPRLALTGSAWKDLSPGLPALGAKVNPYAGFGNLGSGVNLRADYHITENFSVSGGVRVIQGGSYGAGYNPLLQPTGF